MEIKPFYAIFIEKAGFCDGKPGIRMFQAFSTLKTILKCNTKREYWRVIRNFRPQHFIKVIAPCKPWLIPL